MRLIQFCRWQEESVAQRCVISLGVPLQWIIVRNCSGSGVRMEQATTALQLECANAQCYVNLLKVKGSHKTNVHSLSRLHHDKHRVCVRVCVWMFWICSLCLVFCYWCHRSLPSI